MKDFDSYDQFEEYARSIWPGVEKYLDSLKGTINEENFTKAKESILFLSGMVKKHDKAAKFSAKENGLKSGHLGVKIKATQLVFDDMDAFKKAILAVENIALTPLLKGKVEVGLLYPNVFTYTRRSK